MINDSEIDALYIPLPTGVRKDFAIAAAKAGKHVLCEKPCGPNAAAVKEIIDACAEAGVQFMDGVMFMHSDRLTALRKVLDDGESVGQIHRIATQFSFRAPDDFLHENIRMHSELEPLGSLGDLGWYNLRIALWVMNYQMPEKVTGRLITQSGRPDSPDSVPIRFSGELLFTNDVTANFFCSFETEHQQWVNISGSKGHVHIDDFVLGYYGAETGFDVVNPIYDVDGCMMHMGKHTQRIAIPEYSDSHHSAQEAKLFRNFSELVISGKTDNHWPEIALKTQALMDACLYSARNGSSEIAIENL